LVPIEDPQVAAAGGRTHHDNVTFTGRDISRVSGTVFRLSDAELAARGRVRSGSPAYKRIAAMAVSGKQTWVYVDAARAVSASGG